MKKSIFKLLIIITVTSLILLFFAGCKSPETRELEESKSSETAELEERIEALEEELAKKEVKEAFSEEVEAPPIVVTPTEQVEESEENGEEEKESDADKEAPTISLEIYEGPTLDGSICYYRVEATVTGSPNPTVSFSKDDSGGAWGSKKAQVNINNPGDTYTLTATATNSEGSATTSIALSWGCAIPEPDPIEKNVDIGFDFGLSGFINVDSGAYQNATPVVGDNQINKPRIAYISFDISSISSLDDITIKDVSVTITIRSIVGNPELAGSEIFIEVCHYGDDLELTDQAVGGELVKTFNATNSLNDLDFSGNKLEDELQKEVDMDEKWFQLKIELSGVSADGIQDLYEISNDVVLHVKYEIPG
jgi:hypothetical protein